VNRLLKNAAVGNRSVGTHLLLKIDAKRHLRIAQQLAQHSLQPVGRMLIDLGKQMESGVRNDIFLGRVALKIGDT